MGNYEEMTIELDLDVYQKLSKLAKENNTTIEEICSKYLELCAKEKGLIVYDNTNLGYKVLKTKEEVEDYKKNLEDI